MRIVTQLNPDLDACLGVWLLRRFGGYPDAKLAFVSTGDRLPDEESEETIYVDTSGGKYDHHDRSDRVCAASLVLKDLKLEGDEALRKLVDFAILIDHGLLLDHDLGQFNIVHIIYGLNRVYPQKPDIVVDVAGSLFDSLYAYLLDETQAREDFGRAVRFDTRWGPGVGVVTENRQVRYLAHHQGFKVYVFVDPNNDFRGFQSPGGSGVDFSETYEVLRKIEPEADWFLHASKELLLCGSAKAPEKRLSRLSLKALISLVSLQGLIFD